MSTFVAAIDCGATSVRVCRVDLDRVPLVPEVVHRVRHQPVTDPDGHLRWDWPLITSAIIDGLDRCLALGPLSAIGVDTWAVDYGLLDGNGELIGPPYAYRDHRTDDYRYIVDEFGAEAMYDINGLQLLPFNTVFQLARHRRDELERAERMLWLPELIVYELTGHAMTERTSAGSSGLVDVRTGRWSQDMLDLAGIDASLVGNITNGGEVVGAWRDIPVALVAGHDTASAVIGMGAQSPGGSAFTSTGTWMLAGVLRDDPDTSEWARERNFTNEAAALEGFRFLKNITGFWLLERCRPTWGNPTIEDLVESTQRFPDPPIVDVDDPALLAPDDMVDTYTSLAGLDADAPAGLVTASIVASIATRTAEVLAMTAEVSTFTDVVMFGGAARMRLMVEQVAERSGYPVRVGSAEATALGNAIVQGLAIGHFASIEAGQRLIT